MEKLRRSMLFVPGGNEKIFSKALGLDADALILDLEDAVALERKEEARDFVEKRLGETDFGHKEKVVRINPLESPFGYPDLCAVVPARPDALVVPKVNSVRDVWLVDGIVTQIERARRMPEGGIKLILLIETVLSVLNAVDIASCTPRVSGLLFGPADLTLETRGSITAERQELNYAMSRLVMAARAAGVDAIDQPHLDVRDAEGNVRAARQARDFGFDGKACIHPSQIAAINQAFTPSKEDIEFSRRVIKAFRQASAEGKGAVQVDGKLVEILHVQMAERVLKIAAMAGVCD